MEQVTKKNLEEFHNPHGCVTCFEVNKGYIEVDDGSLVCKKCGGTVLLGLQQAFDYISYMHHCYEVDDHERT